MEFCLSQHRGFVVNKDTSTATVVDFNLAGHSLADMSITVIEFVKKNDLIYRKECEEHHCIRDSTEKLNRSGLGRS